MEKCSERMCVCSWIDRERCNWYRVNEDDGGYYAYYRPIRTAFSCAAAAGVAVAVAVVVTVVATSWYQSQIIYSNYMESFRSNTHTQALKRKHACLFTCCHINEPSLWYESFQCACSLIQYRYLKPNLLTYTNTCSSSCQHQHPRSNIIAIRTHTPYLTSLAYNTFKTFTNIHTNARSQTHTHKRRERREREKSN